MPFLFQLAIDKDAMVQYFDKDGNPITLEEHLKQALPGVLDLLATWLVEWFPDSNPAGFENQDVDDTSTNSHREVPRPSQK